MASAEASEKDHLDQEGYIILRGVVAEAECDAIRKHVLLSTDEALRQNRNDLFGNIQEAQNRSDLKLDLCEPVVRALNMFGKRCGSLLSDICGGDARIVELASISSSKGAVAQPVHADTMHGVTRFLQSDIDVAVTSTKRPDDSEDEDADEDLAQVVRAVATNTALIFTALIALQDVEENMGPTHVWPRTNTVEHHATLWSTNTSGKLSIAEADKVFGIQHRKMVLKKGDLVLYDSRTMHCGGANSADVRRAVFCISTMGPGIRPDGTTWTMLDSLRGVLRLSDLPLAEQAITAATATNSDNVAAALPSKSATAGTKKANHRDDAVSGDIRPVPPLQEWEAAVQCSFCSKWRPCGACEAPRLMSDNGFCCSKVGFSCNQEQGYTSAEIDAMF